jgi:hypothetical protein
MVKIVFTSSLCIKREQINHFFVVQNEQLYPVHERKILFGCFAPVIMREKANYYDVTTVVDKV